jgi:type IV pilus assembly protein PilC
MSSFCYEAVNAGGARLRGTLDVADQGEALRRVREMGLFPVKIAQSRQRFLSKPRERAKSSAASKSRLNRNVVTFRPGARVMMTFTRQLATLLDAGMPVLRGLRILMEQSDHPGLKKMIGEVAGSIESGSSLSEALARHPKVFNPLYLNMVRAGEMGGALEITLTRLAQFMEQAQRIKSRVKAAMFYPCAVLVVAVGIVALLMVYVVPKFQAVFDGLMNGASMPRFSVFVLQISAWLKGHAGWMALLMVILAVGGCATVRTTTGRLLFDRFKLWMPLLGPVFRKAAIARFSRTLGTLLQSGVPILQALQIVRETAGNVVIGNVISRIHDTVQEGGIISAPLKESHVFPAMVAGMVDVGEQTGALPDMLMKVADTYDLEVETAAGAMTSLLEPIMIVFLAVVVGSIVIAMFLPILFMVDGGLDDRGIDS